MADPMELATGLEKREILAKLAGNDVSYSLWLVGIFITCLLTGPVSNAHQQERFGDKG